MSSGVIGRGIRITGVAGLPIVLKDWLLPLNIKTGTLMSGTRCYGLMRQALQGLTTKLEWVHHQRGSDPCDPHYTKHMMKPQLSHCLGLLFIPWCWQTSALTKQYHNEPEQLL